MLVEGLRLALISSEQVFMYTSQNPRTLKILSFVIGSIFPTIIVVCSSAVGICLDIYMAPSFLYKEVTNARENKPGVYRDTPIQKYNKCWLDSNSPIYYATVIAPVTFVLITNLSIAFKVTVSLIIIKQSSSSMQRRNSTQKRIMADNVKTATKALLILIPVLGIPWAIGFLSG